MSWLRVDDKFTEHKKLIGLDRNDRWTWLEILCYCARQGNTGSVPAGITDVLQHVTPALLKQCLKVGLLDRDENGAMRVHDWDSYNPKDATKAERQARWRRRKSDGSVGGAVDADVDDSNVYRDGPSRACQQARSRPVPVETPRSEGEGTGPGLEDNAASSPQEATTPPVEGVGRKLSENGMRDDKRQAQFGPMLKQQYSSDRGEQYVHNVLAEVPDNDRANELRYQFPDIPSEELERLLDLAAATHDQEQE